MLCEHIDYWHSAPGSKSSAARRWALPAIWDRESRSWPQSTGTLPRRMPRGQNWLASAAQWWTRTMRSCIHYSRNGQGREPPWPRLALRGSRWRSRWDRGSWWWRSSCGSGQVSASRGKVSLWVSSQSNLSRVGRVWDRTRTSGSCPVLRIVCRSLLLRAYHRRILYWGGLQWRLPEGAGDDGCWPKQGARA